MLSSKECMALEAQYGAKNYKPIPVVISKAKGVWVWDPEGKKYLDCLSSYSAVNQGHLHPKIIKAVKKQMKRVTLTSRAFHNDRLGQYLETLCTFAGLEVALPMNTGAEAVETGIKIARRWGYRVKKVPANQAEIITANENFHGRTTTIVGFSTDEGSRADFGPFTPGFINIPYNDPKALEKAINENTIAFMVEPIQGEAGVIIPDEGYLKKVKDICQKHNVLLILDEIQTGFARTGKMFCFQHEDVTPDILLVGKALSGGVLPVSAAITRHDIMDVITPGSHGSTFGGNPLGCAAAEAALAVLKDEKLDERSRDLGHYFLEGIKQIQSPLFKEVRGKGLFIAIELTDQAGGARQYTEKLKEKGILAKETHSTIIRFAPPLVITKKEIDWALDILKDVFKR
ncbi:MAG: ornithine--oxo-acid transaminase [Acholeplasmataceae bacterium]